MRSFDRASRRSETACSPTSSRRSCSARASALRSSSPRAGPGEAVVVGDVMVDVALATRERVAARTETLAPFGLPPGGYLLATAHRAGNVDDRVALSAFVALLEAVDRPMLLPLHPRTRARLRQHGLVARASAAALIDRAARLPRLRRAPAPRARGADRLGRRPEGGLPRRACRASRCATDRVDRDRRGRLEHARRSRRRAAAAPRSPARRHRRARRFTATVAPPSASSRRSNGSVTDLHRRTGCARLAHSAASAARPSSDSAPVLVQIV